MFFHPELAHTPRTLPRAPLPAAFAFSEPRPFPSPSPSPSLHPTRAMVAHKYSRSFFFSLSFFRFPCPGFRPALPLLRVGASPLRAAGGPVLEPGRAPRRRHRRRAERGDRGGERRGRDNGARSCSRATPPEASRRLPGPRRERSEQGIVQTELDWALVCMGGEGGGDNGSLGACRVAVSAILRWQQQCYRQLSTA